MWDFMVYMKNYPFEGNLDNFSEPRGEVGVSAHLSRLSRILGQTYTISLDPVHSDLEFLPVEIYGVCIFINM